MVDVPALTPVTSPVVALMATVAAERDHVPPDGVAESVIDDVPQSRPGPVMVPGVALTVIVLVAEQPVDVTVYEILTTPGAIPVTVPGVVGTVAIAVLPEDHVPPPVLLVSVIEAP
jgi:hypothetical protein